MTKKRIRQMNSALRRRLTNRPAADWLPDGETFARALEAENYMQRFAPLFHGERLRCADVLALCRPELDALSGDLLDVCQAMSRALEAAPAADAGIDAARYYRDQVASRLEEMRSIIDRMEPLVGADYWPYPTYADILFSV